MKSFVRVVAVCLLLMVAGVGPSWAAEPTINFPTSADTDAWLTNQINRWYGATVDQKMATLNEELTDSETGVDLVAVPSHWPSSGFYIQIHSEYMYVEGTSGVTLTVTRGVGGVNASTHATGATVYFVTTAETFEHMKDSIQAIQNALLNGTLAGIFTTLSAGAAGFSVDADGDNTVKSLTVTKVNGVAGSTLWPEANSSDTDGVGFKGPASATRKLYFQFEDGDPVANEIMKLGTPASVGSDYVSQVTYAPLSYEKWASFNPQDVYDNDTANRALVLDPYTEGAVTITRLYVVCDADPTTEITVTFAYKAAGIAYGTPTTIEAVTTTAGVANITSSIDDSTVPAASKIYVTLSDPDDALVQVSIKVRGTLD